MMINTSECEKCIHGTVEEISKARIVIHCSARNKTYVFGQAISCDDKELEREK